MWQVEGTTKPQPFPLGFILFPVHAFPSPHSPHKYCLPVWGAIIWNFLLWLICSSWHFQAALSECLAWLWNSSGTGMRGNQLSLIPTARGTTGGIRKFMVGDKDRKITCQLLLWVKQTLLGKNYYSFPVQRQNSQPLAHHCSTALPWPISRARTQKAKSFL